ncbi:hypothetical protein H5P92_004448 [Salmonella enterica]|nr:hypothetical protein [Salmonella enterica]
MTEKAPVKLTFPDVVKGEIIDLPTPEEIAANINNLDYYALYARKRRAEILNISLEQHTLEIMTGYSRRRAAQQAVKSKAAKRQSNAGRKPGAATDRVEYATRKPPIKTGVYPTPPINPLETGYINPSYFDKFRRR